MENSQEISSMTRRISPAIWPVMGLSLPFLLPFLISKNHRYTPNLRRSKEVSNQRIAQATPLEMVKHDFVEITPLVEYRAGNGFLGAPTVSYLIWTDRGSVLFDLGF